MFNFFFYEYFQTPKLLQTAEKVCGPYIWKIYDLLVMPPSFPFGGMENPCLTFVTPTLLVIKIFKLKNTSKIIIYYSININRLAIEVL